MGDDDVMLRQFGVFSPLACNHTVVKASSKEMGKAKF